MIVLAILFIVCVLAPIAGFGPIVRHGNTAWNNLYLVTMWQPGTRSQTYRAVLAQEIAEWWLRWAVALPLASLSLLIPVERLEPSVTVDVDVLRVALTIGAVFIASVWVKAIGGRFDAIGRAVEVLVDGRPGHLEAEAGRLRQEWFKGKSVEWCARLIERRFGVARVLLQLLRRSIARGGGQ